MSIIKIAFGLIGGGGLGLPAILGMVVAAIAMMGGLAVWANVKWQNHKTALRNEGAMRCITSVKTAEHSKLEKDFSVAMVNLAREREDAARLRERVSAVREESKSQHLAIADASKGLSCAIPDGLVDEINRPVRALPMPDKTGAKKS